MVRIFYIFIFSSISLNSISQGEIRGRIIDSLSKEKIEYATVSLLYQKDSSLYTYMLSGKDGEFKFQMVPNGVDFLLHISAIGFTPLQKRIVINENKIVDFKDLLFSPSIQQLDEVVINSIKPPVVFKKDTLEFNASAYKVKEDAVIEDLLKQIISFRIDFNGNIFFNGKKITKILIDGKEYFSGDLKIASKNLSAHLVDKIQIVNDLETDFSTTTQPPQKLINIKLKKEVKGKILGKFYLGSGTENRNQVGGIVNLFRDTLQISLIGFSNNLNASSFSFSDIQNLGGFGRSGFNSFSQQDGGGYTLNGNSFGGINNGIQDISSIGLNINNDFNKKVGANFQYFHTNQETNISTLRKRKQFLNNQIFETNSSLDKDNNSISNNLGLSLKLNPYKYTKVRISFSGVITDVNENIISKTKTATSDSIINNSLIKQFERSATNSFTQMLTLNHRFKDAKSNIIVIQNFTYQPDVIESILDNRTIFLSNQIYNDSTLLKRKTDFSSVTSDISLIYRFPVTTKISNGLKFYFSNKHYENKIFTFSNTNKYSLDTLIDKQSVLSNRSELITKLTFETDFNLNENTTLEIAISPSLFQNSNQFFRSYNINKLINYNLLPSVSLFGKKFSFEYYQIINQPALNQLLPVTIVYSPVYQFSGNPFLISYKSHHVFLNYNSTFEKYNSEVGLFLKMDWKRNGLLQRIDINQEGVEQIGIENGNSSKNIFESIEVVKRFKSHINNSFILKLKSDFSFSKNDLIINNVLSDQLSTNISFESSLNWKFKRSIDITALLNWSKTNTKFALGTYSNINWVQKNLILKSSFMLSTKYKLLIDYVFQNNTHLGSEFIPKTTIMNGSLSRKFLKNNKGEIKISFFDLFNQNINIQRIIEKNYIEDAQHMVLRKYFLLSFIFQLNN